MVLAGPCIIWHRPEWSTAWHRCPWRTKVEHGFHSLSLCPEKVNFRKYSFRAKPCSDWISVIACNAFLTVFWIQMFVHKPLCWLLKRTLQVVIYSMQWLSIPMSISYYHFTSSKEFRMVKSSTGNCLARTRLTGICLNCMRSNGKRHRINTVLSKTCTCRNSQYLIGK